jgi:hypothetical protein
MGHRRFSTNFIGNITKAKPKNLPKDLTLEMMRDLIDGLHDQECRERALCFWAAADHSGLNALLVAEGLLPA